MTKTQIQKPVREENLARVSRQQIEDAILTLANIRTLNAYTQSMNQTIEYLQWHLKAPISETEADN